NSLLNVRGIGERKLADLGPRFLEVIKEYCQATGLSLDAATGGRPRRDRSRKPPKGAKAAACGLFTKGGSVEQGAAATDRAPGTVWAYLSEYITKYPSQSVDPWIDPETYRAIAGAAAEVGATYQKPIFDYLNGKVAYEHIRLVLAHLNANRPSGESA